MKDDWRDMFIEVERHEDGPRLRVGPQRVHHGAVGLALLPLARAYPALALLGLGLVLSDLHDARVWFVPGPQR